MGTQLNQIIAVANGQKARTQQTVATAAAKLQKAGLLQGISKVYRPKDEEGEPLPSESKRVQYHVNQALDEVQDALVRLYDVIATQDFGNCDAQADVAIDGKVVLANVPVTTLLFLEKQLAGLSGLMSNLPTLDPGDEWTYNSAVDCYATEPQEQARTKKIPRAFVKYEATKEHPAQVEMYTEDVIVGYWQTTKFSGAIPERERRQMLERVRQLHDAVKRARENANTYEVQQRQIGQVLFDYIRGDTTK